MLQEGKAVDDPRCANPREGRRDDEHDEGSGDHTRDRLPRLALAVERQPFDEDWNERRARNAAENEVEQHVGDGVGEVERVRDWREAQDPSEDEHPQQSGQPRNERSARH